MTMRYISTRGGGKPLNFEEVMLAGLAPDGGLYVPETWPKPDLAALKNKPYRNVAFAVMYPFVEGSIPADDFRAIINDAYSSFRHEKIVPLHTLKNNLYIMEQFHGPTIAFKDVALQLLGRLFDHVLKKRNERVTIVGATSGDTGSAAIEGCRHSKNLDIFILHPAGRVSGVQRRQMTTVDAPNVYNIALEGSFDDCQNMVKAMFNDTTLRKTLNLSAINSINWARIMAQIVYYVTAALELNASEENPVTFVVPTGNFGNVYAGYCARKMGLPINLVVATNENDILTRFFENGEMEKRGVIPTITPSMDIEIPSNFERYLFDRQRGQAGKNDFTAQRTTQGETLSTIKTIYDETGYILDPHTAVGVHAALQLTTKSPIVALATAHPAKFPDAVEKAIGIRPLLPAHLSGLFDRQEKFITLPDDYAAVTTYIKEKVTQ